MLWRFIYYFMSGSEPNLGLEVNKGDDLLSSFWRTSYSVSGIFDHWKEAAWFMKVVAWPGPRNTSLFVWRFHNRCGCMYVYLPMELLPLFRNGTALTKAAGYEFCTVICSYSAICLATHQMDGAGVQEDNDPRHTVLCCHPPPPK